MIMSVISGFCKIIISPFYSADFLDVNCLWFRGNEQFHQTYCLNVVAIVQSLSQMW